MTRHWLILIVIAALCVACTSGISGVPAPDSNEPKIPPRPKELRIDGLDPCSTLNIDQLHSLQIAFSATSAPLGTRGPACHWMHSTSEPVEDYTVAANTNGGVEVVFGQPQLQVIAIAGFGAVETPGAYSSGRDNCIISIDVAPRQALQVGYFYNGATVPMTHEIACGKARNAAELAMKTVLVELGG